MFEMIFFYHQILAQELGPATNLSAIVNVVVYINDINDNAPVFDQEMYVVDLPENITAGTKVAQVNKRFNVRLLFIDKTDSTSIFICIQLVATNIHKHIVRVFING